MSQNTSIYKQYLRNEEIGPGIPNRTKSRAKRKTILELDALYGVKQIAPKTGKLARLETEDSSMTKISSITQSSINFDAEQFEEDQSQPLHRPEHNESEEASSEFLYNGSQITISESNLLLLAFISRHKLTKDSADELLDLVNLFLPANVTIPKSYHSLKKKMNFDYSLSQFHFYCSTCNSYLGLEVGTQCTQCASVIEKNKLIKLGSFFIMFDTKRILKNLIETPKVSNELYSQIQKRKSTETENIIRDITDGLSYKRLGMRENDISCTFNTDGVPIFKSSKFSIWPILHSVNELTYQTRRSNILIAGLWFGNCKPNFDTFFQPFVTQCNELANDGIVWNLREMEVSSRVFFPLLVTDSVARCLCQGLSQFNGTFGCTWCLAEGRMYKFGENSQKWIYPCKGIVTAKRTHLGVLDHLKSYEKILMDEPNYSEKRGHFGIKSASRLLLLQRFDIVDGFAFDYMHAAFLGVSRTITNLWLDSKNHKEAYYCGTKIAMIDDKLLKYAVPFEYDRAIRSISNLKFWKATEWRTWTYISIFVLKDILPEPFLSHFSKFVLGIMLLTGECIKALEVGRAREVLMEFAIGVENLYGLKHCSYNVHILSHAADCVSNWGPLWAYSAFQFENYNGVLLNKFNGTQHIELQIAKSITEMMYIESNGQYFKNPTANVLFLQLVKHRKLHKNVCNVGGNVIFIGSGKLYSFSSEEDKELLSLGIISACAKSYKSCIVRSIVYNTFNAVSIKRCNCVFEIDGEVFIILKLLKVTTEVTDKGLCLASRLRTRAHRIVEYCSSVIDISKKCYLFKLSRIQSKFICGINEANSVSTIIRVPNCKESE